MKKKHNKKLFVIDTNVLLHDYKCIYNFEENDVIIPIVVLEELDRFKRGNDLINFHAREFTRELDKLSGDMLLTSNIPLGDNLGNQDHGLVFICGTYIIGYRQYPVICSFLRK